MKFIAETKEENALAEKLAKEYRQLYNHEAKAIKREDAYAVTMWSVADVQEALDLNNENAEVFLENYENRLEDSSISGGWRFIEYADISDYTKGEEQRK